MSLFSMQFTPDFRLTFNLQWSKLAASSGAKHCLHAVGHRKNGDWDHQFWLVWFVPGRRHALTLHIRRGWTKRDAARWKERHGPERQT